MVLSSFATLFKTPGLRNLVNRTPYMHNGSLRTLREVIDHYNDGFIERPLTLFRDAAA